MKHLLITDLDGTLLGPDSRVSDDSARIITELTHKGALITVATARTPATVEPLLHNTLTTLPAIVMTGAAMWDRENRLYINPLLLSRQQTESLISAYLRHGVHPFTYTLEDNGDMLVHHCKEMSDEEQMFYAERKHLTLKHFIFDNEQCHTSPYTNAILMLGIGDTPRIKALAEELSTDLQLSVSAYPDLASRDISYIEVFRCGVSKAAAVLKLKSILGADRLTVYGDHLNDLPMFAVADESVAVSNALPEVLSAASRIIGPNTLPSVAMDMRKIFHKNL